MEISDEGWWVKYHMNKVITFVAILFAYKFVTWFLDPFYKYKSRKRNKDYEIYENGLCKTKKELGTPFLLRDG